MQCTAQVEVYIVKRMIRAGQEVTWQTILHENFQLLLDFECWMSHWSIISGKKENKQSEQSRHIQFTSYTCNSEIILNEGSQNQIKIVLESHLHWWVRGYILVLWPVHVLPLIQLWMLNKQVKVGENNHPSVNTKQYKGFELQRNNVVLFFAGNRVAAYLSVLNSSKIPLKGKSMHDNELRTTASSNHRDCFY